MDFKTTLEIGKESENLAIKYFNKHNIKYQDVRNNKEYQNIDIDFITDKLGTVEAKYNLTDAILGKQGLFIWWELEVGDNLGWWYKSKADYFLFFGNTENGVLIKNDDTLKQVIEEAIKNGDHSKYGNNRFDSIKDKRFNSYVVAKSMRYYLEDLEKTEVNLNKIIKRKVA